MQKVFATLVEHSNYWGARNGERKYIQWSNTILRGEDGSVTYVIGTGIDRTGEQQLEKELDGRW